MLIVVFGALLMVVTRLFYLQIIEGPRYTDYAESFRLSTRTLPTLRGRILSADGAVLAADLPAYDIGVRYNQLDPLVEGRRWRTVMLEQLKSLCSVQRTEKLKSHRNLDVTIERYDGGWRAIVGLDLVIRRQRQRPGLLGKFLEPVHEDQTERREGDIEIPAQVVERTRQLALVTGEPLDELLVGVIRAGIQIVRLRASPRQLVTVIKGVDYPLVRTIECCPDLFVGYGAIRRAARAYPNGSLAAHSIGYMAVADEEDMRRHGKSFYGDRAKRLRLGDEVGRSGLELVYDEALRGSRGLELAEVDYRGRRQKQLERIDAEAGHDVHLTLDTRWQRAAEAALARAAGILGRATTPAAAVVIDVNSGAVLAIASHPNYDLNTFRKDFPRLNSPMLSPDMPLLNRSIACPMPTGSVFKVIDAIAAVNSGISTDETVECTGRFRIGGKRCHAHGAIAMRCAIQKSCNIYFWEMALRTGAQRLANEARALGLGSQTGIDVPGELGGCIPSPHGRWTQRQERWYDGDTMNLAIGQGEVGVTPVQMAVAMAAVANGGRVYRVHLKKKIVSASGEVIEAEQDGNACLLRTVRIDPLGLAVIHDGMKAVTTEYGGTAFRAFSGLGRFNVSGKTGTAQRFAVSPMTRERYKDNAGWFVGFAPSEKPRVAFAVMVEHLKPDQGAGGTAAKIARVLFDTVPAGLMPGNPRAIEANIAGITGR